jgi:hypothetical protein
MRKGFLYIYMRKCANISPYMRRPLVLCDFATILNFLIYEENFLFFFISVGSLANELSAHGNRDRIPTSPRGGL